MEQQWKEIKSTYRHILRHAFETAEERDRAHVALLKLLATIIDLTFSGDPTLKNGLNVLLGEDIMERASTSTPRRSSDQREGPFSAETHFPNMPNMPNMPNLANMANMNAMFSFADRLMNRSNNGAADNNEFLTSEELRNLFPLWNMFERQDRNDPNDRNGTDVNHSVDERNEERQDDT